MRVLIVDDDRDFLELLAETVSDLGHEVAVARSGNESIRVAEGFVPDVVLVDIVLPDINGITLASLLRALQPESRLRIVGLSGMEPASLAAATDRGLFDECLRKPVGADDIEAVLERCVRP